MCGVISVTAIRKSASWLRNAGTWPNRVGTLAISQKGATGKMCLSRPKRIRARALRCTAGCRHDHPHQALHPATRRRARRPHSGGQDPRSDGAPPRRRSGHRACAASLPAALSDLFPTRSQGESKVKVKLTNVRLSFPDLFEAKEFQGDGNPKFRAAFLIPKDDKVQIGAIEAAIKVAAQEKWKTKADAIIKS